MKALKRLRLVLGRALRQGTTPRSLALTCALGIVLGLFPVFGTTTLLCFAAAVILKLNIPLIQLVNYAIAPLQLILIVPFVKIGSYLFGLNPFPYDTENLVAMFRDDYWSVLRETGIALLAASGVWLVGSVPVFFVVFVGSLWLFQKWHAKNHRELKSQ